MRRLGPAEVYLNGQLATNPADRARVRGIFFAPTPLEISARGLAGQVLAIRFQPEQPAALLGARQLPLLRLWPRTVEQQRQ